MRLAPNDVRRARLRRSPLVAVTLASLLSLLGGALLPALAPWLGPPRGVLLVLSAAAAAGALATWIGLRGRAPGWSSADDVAWVVALSSLAVTAGVSAAPVGVHAVLFATALVLLALRDPSTSLAVVAGATTALFPVLRALVSPSARDVAPAVLAALMAATAFAAVALQTRRLARALAQRDLLLGERERGARTIPVAAPAAAAPQPAAAARVPLASRADEPRRAVGGSGDALEQSWDALVERVRSSVTTIAESAGVVASVQAELSGLAPPSNKIRVHLVRIAQEATTQALRHAEPRSINVTLRRGDGGVVFELQDDGTASESTRHKRTLATLRGRVAALGGTAEVRRADRGWVTRVRLPCEQLN